MELEVSQKTAKICKSMKLDAESLAFADLVAVGWEPSDAYIVASHMGSTWIRKALKDEVQKLLDNQNVKNRIDETKSVLSQRQKDAVKNTAKKEMTTIVDSAMSKEKMLYDLQLAKAKAENGSTSTR